MTITIVTHANAAATVEVADGGHTCRVNRGRGSSSPKESNCVDATKENDGAQGSACGEGGGGGGGRSDAGSNASHA